MKNSYSVLFPVLFLFVSLFTGVSTLQAEVTATATLNTRSFSVDRVAQLSISVQGIRSFQPHMPEIDGLRFRQQGQSTQVEIINGSVSASVTTTYLVQASRSGTFTIPPITVSSKKGDVQTAAITFQVIDAQQRRVTNPSPSANTTATRLRSGEAEEVAFMRLSPAKEASYIGEIVPVTIKVYFRDGIKANLNSLPLLVGEGIVLQQLAREPHRTREMIDNVSYSVLSWNSAFSGIKEGQHIVSVELDATLFLRQQRSRGAGFGGRSSDPFFGNSFFNDFFGSYREKEVKVASPKLDMKVLPLPSVGKPDNFSGAIGDFRLQVKAAPLEISQGDPVTLTMTVSGQGNFDRVQVPQLLKEEGWKSYSPSSEFFEDGNKSRGRKVFEQALVAKGANLKEVPAVAFSYFDPVSKSYKDLVSAPIPLQMKGGMPAKNDGGSVKQSVLQQETAAVEPALEQAKQAIPGLAPLQLEFGNMNQTLKPLFAKTWFQFLCIVLLFALLVVVVLKIHAARQTNDSQLQCQLAMKHLLTTREQEIEARLAAGDSRGFLAVCRTVIQEQLGLAWEVEAKAITLADLKKGLNGDSILLSIFQAADDSAYGGQELSTRQMQELAHGLQKELEALL